MRACDEQKELKKQNSSQPNSYKLNDNINKINNFTFSTQSLVKVVKIKR
jgi:hypothetical protein